MDPVRPYRFLTPRCFSSDARLTSELCLSLVNRVVFGAGPAWTVAGAGGCSGGGQFAVGLVGGGGGSGGGIARTAAAGAEQLTKRASKLGGQRRVEDEVGRTVDHHQQVGHGRGQPEVDLLPFARLRHQIADHQTHRLRHLCPQSSTQRVSCLLYVCTVPLTRLQREYVIQPTPNSLCSWANVTPVAEIDRCIVSALFTTEFQQLGGGYNYDSISVRLPFDCNSTALRPFDDQRYDRAAALRPE